MSDFETNPIGTLKRQADLLEAQPIVLPSVDEAARRIHASDGRRWKYDEDFDWDKIRQGERDNYLDEAQAALYLIASRVPVWVPVEPGTVIKKGTRYRVVELNTAAYEWTATNDWTVPRLEVHGIYIDPRTVPAEPEDPRVDLLASALHDNGGCDDEWPSCTVTTLEHYRADARELLARLDALGANA